MARAYTTDTSPAEGGGTQRVTTGLSQPGADRSAPRLGRLLLRPLRRGRADGRNWRRGWVLALLGVLLGLAMLLHSRIPNTVGSLGSLLQTFLPWVGLGIPVLLLGVVWRRSMPALVALVFPGLVWANLFGGLLSDKVGPGGDLTFVTHNVNAENPDPAGTAERLADSGADVVAVQELTKGTVQVYSRTLAKVYPHHEVEGTIGLWSKHRLQDTRPVDIKLGWTRAMRTTVATPRGDVACYLAHLPSVRVEFRAGFTAQQRDESAQQLGRAIAAERLERVVLLGDLNGTMNDRALAPVTAQMRSTQGAAGAGFGFSWPASFPMARIDQIMVRGVRPVSSWSLPATSSDHLPIAAAVNL